MTDEGQLLYSQCRPADEVFDLDDEQISFSQSEDNG